MSQLISQGIVLGPNNIKFVFRLTISRIVFEDTILELAYLASHSLDIEIRICSALTSGSQRNQQ
jgi:hypothetical protein